MTELTREEWEAVHDGINAVGQDQEDARRRHRARAIVQKLEPPKPKKYEVESFPGGCSSFIMLHVVRNPDTGAIDAAFQDKSDAIAWAVGQNIARRIG